jgi:hypothetical protein
MKLRFSIRDLLWLAALVAVCVAWWADRSYIASPRAALRDKLWSIFSKGGGLGTGMLGARTTLLTTTLTASMKKRQEISSYAFASMNWRMIRRRDSVVQFCQ